MPTYFSQFFSGGVDATWPHAILLSITVLASFAVAAGIIFESPKYSELVHRIAMWAVIVGVAVEAVCTITLFVFDEGISDAQKEKIIVLEKRLASRTLSAEQFDDIVEQTAPMSGQHFDIVTYWKNPEALAIAQRIHDAIVKAGWVYDKPTSGEFIIGVETGVSVAFDKRDGSAVKAAMRLVTVLLQNELYATEDQQSAANALPDSMPISSKLTITVGIKP
jgi:hypothetical protein